MAGKHWMCQYGFWGTGPEVCRLADPGKFDYELPGQPPDHQTCGWFQVRRFAVTAKPISGDLRLSSDTS